MKNANPNFKTGIKTLTDVQIRNSLPGYDTLLKKIELVRENAATHGNKLIIDGSFDSLKYDNIFSILGGRGAGKTSVLHTLYQKLSENENNIRMPVIMPELVDDNDNFIGWILSAIEINLNELENKIKNKGYRNNETTYNFFARCVFNQNNTLRETFNQLKHAYYARVYNHRKGNWDYSTDFSLVSRVNDEGFSLVKRFAEFWNQFIDVYVNYIYEGNSTPLIFFIIDDADLKPSIINELIFCLPKYFSHPNVVVLISAAPKTLGYVVKNHMYQQITGSSFPLVDLMEIEKEYNGSIYQDFFTDDEQKKVKFQELRYGKEYAKITKLTEEILRKLFPVSNRFYLKKYEKYEDKALLVVEDGEDECICPISKIISPKLSNFKNEVLNLYKNTKSKKYNIIKESVNNCITCRTTLKNLVFFGKYPRDILGGYYSFCDFIKELSTILKSYHEEKEKNAVNLNSDMYIDIIRNDAIRFLKAIISSNDNLFMFMQNADKFILKNKDNFELYVDYSVVITTFEEKQFINKNKNNPRPFFEMLILLNFIETILDIAMYERLHFNLSDNGKFFCRLLDICDISIIKKCYNFDEMAEQYIKCENYGILTNFNINSVTHQDYFLDIVYSLELYSKENEESYNKHTLDNKKWTDTLCEVMYLRFGFSNYLKQNRETFKIMIKPMFCDEIYEEIYQLYSDAFRNFIYKKTENQTRLVYAESSKLLSDNDEFQTNILLFNLEFNNATISFSINSFEEDMESFYRELAYGDVNEPLRKEFLQFIKLIRDSDYKINRHMLISKLNSIKLYIEKEYEFALLLSSWNFRLLNRLKNSIKVIKNNYNTNNITFIKKNISNYFKNLHLLYSDTIQSTITTVSLSCMKEIYDNPKDPYMESYITYLRQRDYIEFLKDD